MKRTLKNIMTLKNILIVLSDGHRPETVGCYGNPTIETPYIDELAQQGICVQYSALPRRSPDEVYAQLWTRANSNPSNDPGDSVLHAFTRAGYHTIYTGNWGLKGYAPKEWGFFEHSAAFCLSEQDCFGNFGLEAYKSSLIEAGYSPASRSGIGATLTVRDFQCLLQQGGAAYGESEIPLKDHLTTWITQQAIQALERRPEGSPFLAIVAYNTPHFPLIVPAPYNHIYPPEVVSLPDGTDPRGEQELRRRMACYWGACSLVDAQVGTLRYYLHEKSVTGDTLFVYTSLPSGGIGNDAREVPLVLSGLDLPYGLTVPASVNFAGLLPTIAEWAGITVEDSCANGLMLGTETRHY